VFDLNVRQHYFDANSAVLMVEVTDVLKLNEDEVPVFNRLFPGSVEFKDYPGLGFRAVVVTRGPRGSVLYTADGTFEHPGVSTSVADTVGAGDAFTAALVTGLLDGHDPDRISDFANRLAAYVCSQPGATPPIPAELLATR
jgi:fructokinase